jgi:putative hydrolase of the HAD superfamily
MNPRRADAAIRWYRRSGFDIEVFMSPVNRCRWRNSHGEESALWAMRRNATSHRDRLRSMRTPTAILFDAGGVLLLPGGAQVSAMFADAGIGLEASRCRDAWSDALADADQRGDLDQASVIDGWVRHAGTPPESRARARIALSEELRRTRVAWHEPVDGAHETLAALQSHGMRLACISNSDGTVEHELEILGLAQYFEFIIDSAVVGIAKPDPEIFRLAIDRMSNLAPDECVYVGDTIHFDVKPATHAGLYACHFDRLGIYSTPTPHGVRVSSLPDLLTLQIPLADM